MSDTVINITPELCRVCLQQGCVSIFSQNKPLDFPLSYYLKLICNVDITENDSHPQNLCNACSITLDSAIKLRKTAIKSQLQLKVLSLNCLNIKTKEISQKKCESDLIILPPLENKIIKNEDLVQVQNKLNSPLQKKEVMDSESEDIDNSDTPYTSLSHDIDNSDTPYTSLSHDIDNSDTPYTSLSHDIDNSDTPYTSLSHDIDNSDTPYTSLSHDIDNSDTPYTSLSQNDDIDQIVHNSDVQFTIQKQIINKKIQPNCTITDMRKQNLNHIEYSDKSEATTLTLEQVKKFKSREISYDTYYRRYITADRKVKYQCRICKKDYKKGSVNDHLFTHLPDSVSQYVCEYCGKGFKTLAASYTHRVVHIKTLSFECKLCPYKGRSKVLLQVHNKRMHKREYNYPCKLCPRKFLDASNLQKHVRRHGEPKYPCLNCERQFYDKSTLNMHIQVMHIDIEPHKCDICGNLFKHRGNMLAHQIKVHKRKRVYNNRAAYLKLDSGKT